MPWSGSCTFGGCFLARSELCNLRAQVRRRKRNVGDGAIAQKRAFQDWWGGVSQGVMRLARFEQKGVSERRAHHALKTVILRQLGVAPCALRTPRFHGRGIGHLGLPLGRRMGVTAQWVDFDYRAVFVLCKLW